MHMSNLAFIRDALGRFLQKYGESPIRMEFSPWTWADICDEVEPWMVQIGPSGQGESLCGVSVLVVSNVVPRFVTSFGGIEEM